MQIVCFVSADFRTSGPRSTGKWEFSLLDGGQGSEIKVISVENFALFAMLNGKSSKQLPLSKKITCSGMLRLVALVRIDVSEEHIVSMIRVTRIAAACFGC
jgi:hypothetical protein